MIRHVLVGVLLGSVVAPRVAGAEEWKFLSHDHGQPIGVLSEIRCLPSGNIWLHSWARSSQFDGLIWRSGEASSDPPMIDDRGGMWLINSSPGFGIWVGQVDSRSGLMGRSAYLEPTSVTTAAIYSSVDSAILIGGGGDYLASFPWNTDPYASRPFRVPGGSLAAPRLNPAFTSPLVRLNDGEIWLRGIDGWYRRVGTEWVRSDRLVSMLFPPFFHSPTTGLYWTASSAAQYDSALGWSEGPTEVVRSEAPGVGPIGTFFEDASGHLWAQGAGGLAIRLRAGWLTVPAYEGLAGQTIRRAACDSSGHIWSTHAGEDLTLVRSDGSYVIPLDGVPPPSFQASTGALYAARNDSLFIRRGSRVTVMPDAGSPLHEDAAGMIWLSHPAGVKRLRPNDGLESTVAWPTGTPLTFVVADAAETLWFRSDIGLHAFDGTKWSSLVFPSPPHIVAGGGPGAVWIASADSGLRRFDIPKRRWEPPIPLPDLGNDIRILNFIKIDSRGEPWLCLGDFTLYGREGGSWVLQHSHLYVEHLFEDPRGRLYASGVAEERWWPSVIVKEGGEWKSLFPPDPISGEYPVFRSSVFFDSRREPWLFGEDPTLVAYAGFVDAESVRTVPLRVPVRRAEPVFLDTDDQLWFAHHVVRLDRTPPVTMILNPPAPRISTQNIFLSVAPVLESATGVQHRGRQDGEAWGPWSTGSSLEFSLGDGRHCVEVQSRDRWGNIEPTPQQSCFEIDSTPPQGSLAGTPAVITGSDPVVIVGSAADPAFASYQVTVSPLSCGTTDSLEIHTFGPVTSSVSEDTLAVFSGLGADWREGRYLVELDVRDNLGLRGITNMEIVLDRVPPPAEATSPAFRSRTLGGAVFAEGAGASLFIPPLALVNDGIVRIQHVDASAIAAPPEGARIVGDPISISWDSGDFERAAALSIRPGSGCQNDEPPPAPDTFLAIHRLVPGEGWTRLGGTPRPGRDWIDVPVTRPGTYAVVVEGAESSPPQAALEANLVLSPRMLRRDGTGAPAILLSFTMESPGRVSGFVHNRAGRMVRTLADGSLLGSGVQSLRWDGLDESGERAREGIYLLTVQTPVRTLRATCLVQGP